MLSITPGACIVSPCPPGSALERELVRDLTVTPITEFSQKNGFAPDPTKSFSLLRRLPPPYADAVCVPRGYALRRFGAPASVQLSPGTPRAMQHSATPLRPTQHLICYEKFVPALQTEGVGYWRPAAGPEPAAPAEDGGSIGTEGPPPTAGPTFCFGGLVILPCGEGKTRCAAEFAILVGQRTLFVPPTSVIADQSALAFARFIPGCKVVVLKSTPAPASAGGGSGAKKRPAVRVLVPCRRRAALTAAHPGPAAGTEAEAEPDAETEEDADADADAEEPADEPADAVELRARRDAAKIADADVVICVASTLKAKNYPSWFYQQFGLVIFDEAHRMCAPGFAKLMLRINAQVMIGITAEHARPDGTFHVLHDVLGPTLFEKRSREPGKDDVLIRKCVFGDAQVDRMFASLSTEGPGCAAASAAAAARRAKFCATAVSPLRDTVNFTETLSNVLFEPLFLRAFARVLLFARDEFPERRGAIRAVRALKPHFEPIFAPISCSRCEKECVFWFSCGGLRPAGACGASGNGNRSTLSSPCTGGVQLCSTCAMELADDRSETVPCPCCGGSMLRSGSALTAAHPETKTETEEEEVVGAAAVKCRRKQRAAGPGPAAGPGMAEARKVYESTYFGRNQMLVLCTRVEPLHMLADALVYVAAHERGETDFRAEDHVGMLVGHTKSDVQLHARARQFVFATNPKAKEGMDIPQLRAIHFLSPQKTLQQAIGRMLRVLDGRKDAYDWIFPQRFFTAQYHKHRAPYYRANGYRVQKFAIDSFLGPAAGPPGCARGDGDGDGSEGGDGDEGDGEGGWAADDEFA